jgi:lysophospholipid acyltransferase (LPLAT)-like uncharacterized protein
VEQEPEVPLKIRLMGQATALLLPRAVDLLNIRIAHYDRSADPARPEYNEHMVFSFWHEFIGVILPRWGYTPLSILASQHRDGEWVSQTALSLGLRIVRGSSTRGGASAIRRLKQQCTETSLAITPDGPRGPRRKMAIGPVFMASRLGLPLVTLGIGVNDAWRLKTWDQFVIPKPLSRVRIIFGPKIFVPPKAKREELESIRQSAENLMNELSDQAEAWAISGKKMIGEQPFTRVRRRKVIFEGTPSGSRSQRAISDANAESDSKPRLNVIRVG